jgi:mono/diheme cytochrome c family protein
MKGPFNWAAMTAFTVATAAAAAAPGTSAGVYTTAQAASGAAVYAQRCAMCHGKTGDGNWEVPPLTGRFMANWGTSSMAALSDYIGRAMPQFAPGTLGAKDRTDLLAYLLQINGQPSGPRPLPEDGAPLAAMPIDAAPRPTSR